MNVTLLGTAAGGGFPQWNCWCPTCRTARDDPRAARPRTQSSAAVSADGTRWFLLNASPDVRAQLARLPSRAADLTRSIPFEGILLTDAELDHTLGIPLLREGGRLDLYASEAVASVLESASRLLPVTRAFADVRVTTLRFGGVLPLLDRDGGPSGLTAEPFDVAGHAPRFAAGAGQGHTVGLLIRDDHGGCCAYVPGCGALDADLLGRLHQCGLVLFDGTFWSDDEMRARGLGTNTAREMGHLPIGGDDGSLRELRALPGRVVYVHVNNTNPVLLEASGERAVVEAAGISVGYDGMELTA